jgi:uncharacterized membrane protein
VDRYELLKFLHIAAAIVWVGGGTVIQFFALRTLWSGDPLRLATFGRDVDWIGNRVFVPSALAVIVLGFLLVWDGPFELGMTWIWLSLVIFAVSFLAGAAFFGPESKRIANQVEAEGPESPAVQARIGRLIRLTRIDLVLLFAIVFLMVVKPD